MRTWRECAQWTGSPGLVAQSKCSSGRKELSLESSFLYVLMLSSTHVKQYLATRRSGVALGAPWQAWRCSTYHVMCVLAHTCRLMAVRGHCSAGPSGSVADAVCWLHWHRSLPIRRSAAFLALRMPLHECTARKLTVCDRLPRRCLRRTLLRCARSRQVRPTPRSAAFALCKQRLLLAQRASWAH